MRLPNKKILLAGIFIGVAGCLLSARLYLNVWLTEYVNGVLANIDGYKGSVSSIDIDLYRGAYRIHDLQIYKKKGDIPTPFITVRLADLSVEWWALFFHGRIVSNADLIKPTINFAINEEGTDEQTGSEADWSRLVKDLMPIDINLLTFREGKITYQDFSAKPQVNLYINNITGEARNLRNIVDKEHKLPSTLIVSGDSIGNGKLNIDGKMNILKNIPDMDLNVILKHASLPAFSDYSNAYAAIDIKEGDLNVYSEFILNNGRVSGYVKPIATGISLIDLRKKANPIKIAWEVIVASVVELFTNQSKNQFATKVELYGRLDDINTSRWSAAQGIISNAFIRAFKQGLDKDIKIAPE